MGILNEVAIMEWRTSNFIKSLVGFSAKLPQGRPREIRDGQNPGTASLAVTWGYATVVKASPAIENFFFDMAQTDVIFYENA
jgi:hypothetical protein